MSLDRVIAFIRTVSPREPLTAEVMTALRAAAGSSVSNNEMQTIDDFVRARSGSFSSETAREYWLTFARPCPSGLELRRIGSSPLSIPETSGVAMAPNGQVVAIDDERGLYVREADGTCRLLLSAASYPEVAELEGLCCAPNGRAYLLSEATGDIVSTRLEGTAGALTASPPQLLGKLPVVGHHANKGWEGIALLPAAFTADAQDLFVAVHEGKPRRIGVFDAATLEQRALLPLPEEFRRYAPDLSDIAVDSVTGAILLLSDEGRTLLECTLNEARTPAPGAILSHFELVPRSVHSLEIPADASPEGVCFVSPSEILVVCDGHDKAYHFEVQRPNAGER